MILEAVPGLLLASLATVPELQGEFWGRYDSRLVLATAFAFEFALCSTRIDVGS